MLAVARGTFRMEISNSCQRFLSPPVHFQGAEPLSLEKAECEIRRGGFKQQPKQLLSAYL